MIELIMAALEAIPLAVYTLIIGLCVSFFVIVATRLFRPDPPSFALLSDRHIQEIEGIEGQMDVTLIAYKKASRNIEGLGGPINFLE